jgi:oligopeptide/dipeptide ABC transporter ATP-binding protein
MSFLFEVKDLHQRFELGSTFLDRIHLENGRIAYQRKYVHAVNGINLHINKGEVLGIVGESGCGKSTLAKTAIQLYRPIKGKIFFEEQDITNLSDKNLRPLRRRIQMIFQDPYSSLNRRQKVGDIISEALLFHKRANNKNEAREKALGVLSRVGLNKEQANRYPHQFSGGQRQRIGIARALAIEPDIIFADEPVSALDVSIQAQIINLIIDLKHEFNFSFMIIAHDISVIHHLSDRVGVMYLGFMVESGKKQDIFRRPLHPYTRVLMSAAPALGKRQIREEIVLEGEVPSAIDLPGGCCFQSRCPYVFKRCLEERPILRAVQNDHEVACHKVGD